MLIMLNVHAGEIYTALKEEQIMVLVTLINSDVFAILPTGWKPLCYSLPWLYDSLMKNLLLS